MGIKQKTDAVGTTERTEMTGLGMRQCDVKLPFIGAAVLHNNKGQDVME